jgi:hypothetical protein|tara:strand:- start:3548 stop:3691 length:144 start_codon:yes stop_codon:yes gene_type:complete
MKTFEKNPVNGGIPAIEKKAIKIILEKTLSAPKSLKEKVVFFCTIVD